MTRRRHRSVGRRRCWCARNRVRGLPRCRCSSPFSPVTVPRLRVTVTKVESLLPFVRLRFSCRSRDIYDTATARVLFRVIGRRNPIYYPAGQRSFWRHGRSRRFFPTSITRWRKGCNLSCRPPRRCEGRNERTTKVRYPGLGAARPASAPRQTSFRHGYRP